MKKLYYLIAMALMGLTFTSCEDVPAPFGQPQNPNQGSEETIDPKGSGTTEADPFNVAAAINKCKEVGEGGSSEKYYIKGIVVEEGVIPEGDTYGNITFKIADTKDSKKVFIAYQVFGSDGEKLPVGFKVNVDAEVVLYGPVVNYKNNTPETQGKGAAHIVTINGKKTSGDTPSGGDEGGGGDTPPAPTGDNLLTNGDFEAWTGDAPDNWNGVTGNATIEKSTTGRSGNAILVKGATSNKRLAYKEIKLKAGTYIITAYAKAATENKASLKPGYAKLTNGAVADTQNDYKYGDYTNDITNADWKVVSHSFTLNEETSLNIIFMNPKSTASDVIIDDVTLTTSDGGLIEGGESGGGDTPTPPASGAYLDESFANGQGDFTIEDKVGSGIWTAASYQSDFYMKATSYINSTNTDGESWLISPDIDLSTATSPVLTFAQVINGYFGTIADEAMVYAKKDGGEWTKLTITYPAKPSKGYTKFTDADANVSVSLTDYKSAKTKIAFVYKGSATKAGTWEIKDIKVAEAQ